MDMGAKAVQKPIQNLAPVIAPQLPVACRNLSSQKKNGHKHVKFKQKQLEIQRWETPNIFTIQRTLDLGVYEYHYGVDAQYSAIRKTEGEGGVYNILTEAEVRRAWPTDEVNLKKSIQSSIISGNDIKIIGLWGGFKEGPTGEADIFDIAALDRLEKLKEKIQSALDKPYHESNETCESDRKKDRRNRQTVNITLLFCDMHHIIASGVSEESCTKYYNTLSKLAKERGINVKPLSEYYQREYAQKLHYSPWYARSFAWFSKKPTIYELYNLFTDKTIERRTEALWADEGFRNALLEMARKRHTPYCDRMTEEERGKAYIATELGFLKIIKQEIDSVSLRPTVVFSYSRPDVQGPLFDTYQIPHVFFCATKKKLSDCPWFLFPGKADEKSLASNETSKQAKPARKTTFFREMMFGYIKKIAIAGSLALVSVMAVGYLLPYPLFMAKNVTDPMFEEHRNLRNKYAGTRITPSFREFVKAGYSKIWDMREFCRHTAFSDLPPGLKFMELRPEERDALLVRLSTIMDIKNKGARTLYREATLLRLKATTSESMIHTDRVGLLIEAAAKYKESLKFEESIAAWVAAAKCYEFITHNLDGRIGTDTKENYIAWANTIFLERGKSVESYPRQPPSY